MSSEPTFSVKTRDVEYFHADGSPLLARLYEPQGKGPFPAVVDAHPGAWRVGDYLMDAPLCERLASWGIVCFSVDFRQAPATRYPTSIADIHGAIRWLKAHASECATTSERVGGLGLSSGGHQLMLCAMCPDDPRYAAHEIDDASGVDARLRFAVLLFPIVDPLARYQMAKRLGGEHYDHLVESHDLYWRSEQEMEEGNPQRLLDRGELVELPPVLVLQGAADDNVTADMAPRFVASYEKAGGHAELEMYEGAPHGFNREGPDGPTASRALARTRKFVLRYSAS